MSESRFRVTSVSWKHELKPSDIIFMGITEVQNVQTSNDAENVGVCASQSMKIREHKLLQKN